MIGIQLPETTNYYVAKLGNIPDIPCVLRLVFGCLRNLSTRPGLIQRFPNIKIIPSLDTNIVYVRQFIQSCNLYLILSLHVIGPVCKTACTVNSLLYVRRTALPLTMRSPAYALVVFRHRYSTCEENTMPETSHVWVTEARNVLANYDIS
jgi:hypothetical protein